MQLNVINTSKHNETSEKTFPSKGEPKMNKSPKDQRAEQRHSGTHLKERLPRPFGTGSTTEVEDFPAPLPCQVERAKMKQKSINASRSGSLWPAEVTANQPLLVEVLSKKDQRILNLHIGAWLLSGACFTAWCFYLANSRSRKRVISCTRILTLIGSGRVPGIALTGWPGWALRTVITKSFARPMVPMWLSVTTARTANLA